MSHKYIRAMGWLVARAAAVLALGGILLAGAAPARAMLLVYEPFAYAPGIVGGQTTTGLNLTGTYLGSIVPPGFELKVESPGLGYGNLVPVPAAAGNRLSQTLGTTGASATASIDQDVIVNPGDEIFFSALLRLDDSLNGNHLANITLSNDENGDAIGFGEAAVGVRAIRVSAQTAATGGSLVAAGADLAFTSGELLLLMGRYLNAAAADGDRLELIGYDTADADVLPTRFDPADPNAEFAYALTDLDIDMTKITSVTFTIRGTANNLIDELRIGTRYGDLVPEPATASLLLAGFVGLGPVFTKTQRKGRNKEKNRQENE